MAFHTTHFSKYNLLPICSLRLRHSIYFLVSVFISCDRLSAGVDIKFPIEPTYEQNISFKGSFTPNYTTNIIDTVLVDRDHEPNIRKNQFLSSFHAKLLMNSSLPSINSQIKKNNSAHHQVFNLNATNPINYSLGLPQVLAKVMKNKSRILTTYSILASSKARIDDSVILAPGIKARKLRNVRKNRKLIHGSANPKTLLSSDGRKILTILGLFEFSDNNTVMKRESGESERASAQMALDDVNANDKILSGYKLIQITNDTQCDPGVGVDAFFHALYSRKNTSTKIISLLGTACSEVTERVAKVATHQRIVQVSFGSTSPSLSDRKEFPIFYRTVAPISSHVQAIIELIAYFNWDTVSFFTENENQYSMPVNHLVKEMEEKNITCKETLTFSLSDFQDQLSILNESDSRIIIASFGVDIAPKVFCEVYKRKMYGPDYAWIWMGKPDTIWWKEDTTTTFSRSSFPPYASSRSRWLRTRDGNATHIQTSTQQGFNGNINNDTNYMALSEVDERNGTNNPYHLGTLRMKGTHSGGSSSSREDKGETSHQKQPSIKSELDCSRKELTIVIENTIVVDRFNVLDGKRVSDFGLTTESFRSRLRERMQMEKHLLRSPVNIQQPEDPSLINKASINPLSIPLSQFAPETYDAVWTIALGLQKLQEKYNYPLENFNYMDDYFSHLLNEEIGKLKFTGISGPITFSGSDRIGTTSFIQIQGGSLFQVGLFHPDREENKLELWKCSDMENPLTKPRLPQCWSIKWPGNQVPISRREFRTKILLIDSRLYIFVAAVAFLGILLATAFLAFNLYYRKLKYIKLSSPRLNNMVIIGCMLAYFAVIILGFDFGPPSASNEIRFSYICTIRAYLLSFSFSLAFGAMFVKTYRVHRIFTRSCIGVVKNKLLKDTQLMTLVMALLLIDVIIVTSWAVVDPMHRHLQNLTLQKDVSDRSVVYQPQIEVCRSQHGHVWLSVMYAYKCLLLVIGSYMAWETRHVKIHALNDSKNIAYCVYIVVLTSVLAVSLANLISERVTLSWLCVTSLILTSTTVTLCLLFLPKIHTIKTGGHKGDPVVQSMGLKIEFNTRRLVVEDAKELLFRAEVQNRVYKRQIEAIDVEIWRLENLLLCSSHSSLMSLDNAKKSNKNPRTSKDSASGDPVDDSNSSEETSEIYTVYLHGPRFIVPISVLNFQNPNAADPLASCNSSKVKQSSATLHPPAPPPRSSWPNIRSLLTPSGTGLITKMRFKSEPKLLIEEPTTTSILGDVESGRVININPENLLSPRVTFGGSDDSFGGGDSGRSNISKSGKGSRKSSNTSTGGLAGSSKRSSFLTLLKQPFAYFSGMVRSGASSASPTLSKKHKIGDNYGDVLGGSDYDDEPQVFHLHVPRDSIRKKFNSVPDLWAVRTSPIMQHYPKKTSVVSDSLMDSSSSLRFMAEANQLQNKLSSSNPVLKLTVTSDASPYL